MGCNVKEKSLRAPRKHRPSSSSSAAAKPPPSDPNPNPNPNPNPSPNFCTESQLEDLLLNNLDLVYKEALSRLISLGYDETLALRAILYNGHCYGSMDVLSNILHNSISFLNSDSAAGDLSGTSAAAFSDLRHLQEYSLNGLICLIQQVRPHLTRGDAMWCLLMSELHLQRATSIEIPKQKVKAVDRSKSNGSVESDDVVLSVMKSLESLSIEGEEGKRDRVISLIQQIQELETQVKERKEWAQERAMQAAKKLSNDLSELKALRMEKEENLRAKKGKQAVEDTAMMKRLSEMENALKKASGEVDQASSAVKRLTEMNAEIKAEMEASKLSASESASACLEAEKREKKCLKRLATWEKAREKLMEDIKEERKRIEEVERELAAVREAQKEAEIKWRQEIKAKEQAITLVEEEHRAKEAADANIKRSHEALRRKIEVDFQRHKDDIRRLEEELSRLKSSPQPTKQSMNALNSDDAGMPKPTKETNKKTGLGFHKPQDLLRKANCSRECMICIKEEVNVVFLPCAHQVLCYSCSQDQERKAKANCPCCNARIDQRIHVYGARSS